LETRKETRREVRTILSETTSTVWALGAMSVGAVFLINAIEPGIMRVMTTTVPGVLVLLVVAALFTVGFLLVSRITKFDLSRGSDVRLRTGPLRVAVHDRAGLRTPCAPGLLQRVLADVTDPGERGGGRTAPGSGPFGTDLRSAPDHRGDRAPLRPQCPGFVG